MRYADPEFLKSLRTAGPCELCGKPCLIRCGAHIFAKGNGGSDIWINIVQTAINPWAGCDCHLRHHNGDGPTRADFIACVAKRERITADAIIDVNHLLIRLPKRPSEIDVTTALRELSGESYRLAAKVLREIGL